MVFPLRNIYELYLQGMLDIIDLPKALPLITERLCM